MSQITLWLPHTGIPGTGNEIHTTEVDLGRMIYGNIQGFRLQPAGSIVDGASLDAGNTGFTAVLREGLIMGQVTATKKWKPFASGASDGTEIARGVLLIPTAIPNGLDIVNASILVGGVCLEPGGLCLASSATYGLAQSGAGATVRKHFAFAFQFSDDFMNIIGVPIAAR